MRCGVHGALRLLPGSSRACVSRCQQNSDIRLLAAAPMRGLLGGWIVLGDKGYVLIVA